MAQTIEIKVNTTNSDNSAQGRQIIFNEKSKTISCNGKTYGSFEDHNVSWTVIDE